VLNLPAQPPPRPLLPPAPIELAGDPLPTSPNRTRRKHKHIQKNVIAAREGTNLRNYMTIEEHFDACGKKISLLDILISNIPAGMRKLKEDQPNSRCSLG
jgi:hypothetical protein